MGLKKSNYYLNKNKLKKKRIKKIKQLFDKKNPVFIRIKINLKIKRIKKSNNYNQDKNKCNINRIKKIKKLIERKKMKNKSINKHIINYLKTKIKLIKLKIIE